MGGAADLIGTGGVAGAVVVGFGYLLWYLIKRRGSETGVVETTREALRLVRDEQQIMGAELRTLRVENVDLRTQLRDRGHEATELKHQNASLLTQLEQLATQNAELRARLDALERRSPPS